MLYIYSQSSTRYLLCIAACLSSCICMPLIMVDSTIITSMQSSCLSNDTGNLCGYVCLWERERERETDKRERLLYISVIPCIDYTLEIILGQRDVRHRHGHREVRMRERICVWAIEKNVCGGGHLPHLHNGQITGRGDRRIKRRNQGDRGSREDKNKEQRTETESLRIGWTVGLGDETSPRALLCTPISSWT